MMKANNSSLHFADGVGAIVFLGWRVVGSSAVAQSIASAFDLDDLGVVEEAVEDGRGGGHIVEQLAPFLDGPIGSHERGAGFVTAHDDFQEHFPGLGRQDLESHVIDDQEIGFEIAAQGAVQLFRGLIGLKLPDHVEDGAVEDLEAGFDEVVADGLNQMALAQTGWPDKQAIPALADELAGGQIVDLLSFDGGIECPIEVLQGLLIPEASGFGAFGDQALMADVDFILEDQFQELFMGQLMGAGFLQTQFQAGEQAREA